MRGVRLFVIGVGLLSIAVSEANAQCSSDEVRGSVSATGTGGVVVRATAISTGPSERCPDNGDLQAESWIPSAPNSDWKQSIAASNVGATARSEYHGNVWGRHIGNSKHHQIYDGWFGRVWSQFADNEQGVDLGDPPGGNVCPPPGEEAIDPEAREGCESPIIIDVDSNAYRLTSPTNGVDFDINADGVIERVAWTHPRVAQGFLALDRNGNGTIDDGSELFGTATPLRNGSRAFNGFRALQDLDGGVLSNGKIDRWDTSYYLLRLWFDANHNGFSEADELVSLADAGVDTIFTGYQESRRVDRHGNKYAYFGSALISLEYGRLHRRRIYDVFLTY